MVVIAMAAEVSIIVAGIADGIILKGIAEVDSDESVKEQWL